MGNQSSTSAVQENSSQATKSHYELLDIPTTATDDEIKKAYRRKALELHPDRNHGKEEAATLLFTEIQAAYSVLSDPQERAWYDSHQAEFTSGGVTTDDDGEVKFRGGVRITSAEDIRSMMASRNRSMSDVSDSSSGFFTSIRELFERLALEEGIASGNAGADLVDYPSFGASQDEFQDVVKTFYSVWQGFSTVKTFAWKDRYRAGMEYDRRTRRIIEKENQKARDEAAREFNDAVRALVLFIRRRDPRYIASATTDAERQKALRDAAAAQAIRARKANAEKLAENVIPDWARSRGDQESDDYATEDEEGQAEDEEEEEESEEIEPEIWECVVCDKIFKSEGQFDAHERSKKHKQAAAKIRKEMRQQNTEFGLNEPKSYNITVEDDLGESVDPMQDIEHKMNEKLDINGDINQEMDTAVDLRPDSPPIPTSKTTKHISSNPQSEQEVGTESEEEIEDDTYGPRSDVESRMLGQQLETSPAASTPPIAEVDSSDTESKPTTGASTPKLGKAKEKRAKKAAARVKMSDANSSAARNAAAGDMRCVACEESFVSKNRLFEHIKRTGHARPVVDSNSALENGTGRKKKKR